MIITFFVYAAPHPMGGSKTIYELANQLTRRGHQIHLIHFGIGDEAIQTAASLTWFDFEPGIEHRLMQADGDYGTLPEADFIQPLNDQFPPHAGQPFSFVQGFKVMPPDLEILMYSWPWPKICVADWLVDVGLEMGVHGDQLVMVPNGINHERFQVIRPIEDRSPQVAMPYHDHFMKGTKFGLEALIEARSQVPDLTARLFGTTAPPPDLPNWITASRLPSRSELANEIYNGSSVFLCPGLSEGFGLTSVEAMASGCALVTADNGGSNEFAIPGETALVAPKKDASALAAHLVTLLTHQDDRIAMARRGAAYVQRFRWERSADLLEAFLESYGLDPDRYRQPNDLAPAAGEPQP